MLGEPKTKQELIAALQKEPRLTVETVIEGTPKEVASKIASLRKLSIQVIVIG
jgi:ketopantoate hydroxymethyltransferase